ncbi:carboxypeptidase regulatory-like domain-containing protein [uncultured Jatrophihabitans sp.]|uniref:carboxypeptidase regulatory-like domain-containing protein n=1 Tax=uncultured Jatrophihabitans sp. TaxID=1610747 RepID=UPI0035CA7112
MHLRRPLALVSAGALTLAGFWGLAPSATASTALPPVRSATAKQVADGSVALAWTNPAKATATVVRMARGGTAPRTARSGTSVATVRTPHRSVSVRHLALETTYSFALFSTRGHGTYSKASVVRVITRPAGVYAVHVTSTENSLSLHWTNPAASMISGIVVRYAAGRVVPAGPTSGKSAALSSKASSVTIAGLTPGMAYAVGIWVRDSHGHYSAPAGVRGSTVPLPGAVSELTQSIKAPSAVLRWRNPTTASFTGVRVCRTDGVTTTAPNPASCVVTGTDGTELGKVTTYHDPTIAVEGVYTYWVFAHDDLGHYASGASVSVTGPPAAVSSAGARKYSATSALVTWTAPHGTDVRICRVDSGVTAPDPDACGATQSHDGSTTGSTSGLFVDGTALPGRSYDYYVFVRDGSGVYSVPVEAGLTMPTPAGATVEGTVSGTGSAGVAGVTVYLIAPNGRPVADTDEDGVPDSDVIAHTTTHLDGTYAFTSGATNTDGLAPNNVGAYVCVDATGSDSDEQTGYASGCHGSSTAWGTDPERPIGGRVPLANGVIDTADVALTAGGAIAGTVLASSDHKPAAAEVDVFSTTTAQESDVPVGPTGSYSASGLNPGTYVVCYYGEASKAAPTGYAPQCYRSALVGTSTRPTTVQVRAGVVTKGVSDAVTTGAQLFGQAFDASTKTALGDVDVYVFDSNNELVAADTTAANGAYSMAGLPVGLPLTVCVDGEYSTANSSGPGYDAECHSGVPWDVVDAPGPAAPVTLTAGLNSLNFDLAHTGAVSGTVTNANGFGVGNVGVTVFGSTTDAAGRPLEWDGVTDSSGAYLVGGLPAGSYRVCFDARHTDSPTTHGPGYASRCNGVPTWNGAGPVGDPVSVTVDSTTPLAASLERAGGIDGVARDGNGAPLTDVAVTVFDATGATAGTVRTGDDGSYWIPGLTAGSYRVCWSGAGSISVDTTAPVGYSSGCQGSSTSWDGGAPAAGAAQVDVATDQANQQDLALTPLVASAPRAALRTTRVATAQVASSGRSMAIRATERLAGRVMHRPAR